MIGRRSFLTLCGWMLAALAGGGRTANAMEAAVAVPPPPPVEPPAIPAIALRVHGWDAPPAPGATAEGQLWIKVSGSWRTAWR